jgi:hypothetical protein
VVSGGRASGRCPEPFAGLGHGARGRSHRPGSRRPGPVSQAGVTAPGSRRCSGPAAAPLTGEATVALATFAARA